MSKWAQGVYQVINTKKYVGQGMPRYRSGWEHSFMRFCDTNDNIMQWASESVRIPYLHPLTGKMTTYVPDFLITYQDAAGGQRAEVIEVKPRKETTLEGAKNIRDQASAILNMAKWEAARAWCRAHNLTFRVVTEDMIFHQGHSK